MKNIKWLLLFLIIGIFGTELQASNYLDLVLHHENNMILRIILESMQNNPDSWYFTYEKMYNEKDIVILGVTIYFTIVLLVLVQYFYSLITLNNSEQIDIPKIWEMFVWTDIKNNILVKIIILTALTLVILKPMPIILMKPVLSNDKVVTWVPDLMTHDPKAIETWSSSVNNSFVATTAKPALQVIHLPLILGLPLNIIERWIYGFDLIEISDVNGVKSYAVETDSMGNTTGTLLKISPKTGSGPYLFGGAFKEITELVEPNAKVLANSIISAGNEDALSRSLVKIVGTNASVLGNAGVPLKRLGDLLSLQERLGEYSKNIMESGFKSEYKTEATLEVLNTQLSSWNYTNDVALKYEIGTNNLKIEQLNDKIKAIDSKISNLVSLYQQIDGDAQIGLNGVNKEGLEIFKNILLESIFPKYSKDDILNKYVINSKTEELQKKCKPEYTTQSGYTCVEAENSTSITTEYISKLTAMLRIEHNNRLLGIAEKAKETVPNGTTNYEGLFVNGKVPLYLHFDTIYGFGYDGQGNLVQSDPYNTNVTFTPTGAEPNKKRFKNPTSNEDAFITSILNQSITKDKVRIINSTGGTYELKQSQDTYLKLDIPANTPTVIDFYGKLGEDSAADASYSTKTGQPNHREYMNKLKELNYFYENTTVTQDEYKDAKFRMVLPALGANTINPSKSLDLDTVKYIFWEGIKKNIFDTMKTPNSLFNINNLMTKIENALSYVKVEKDQSGFGYRVDIEKMNVTYPINFRKNLKEYLEELKLYKQKDYIYKILEITEKYLQDKIDKWSKIITKQQIDGMTKTIINESMYTDWVTGKKTIEGYAVNPYLTLFANTQSQNGSLNTLIFKKLEKLKDPSTTYKEIFAYNNSITPKTLTAIDEEYIGYDDLIETKHFFAVNDSLNQNMINKDKAYLYNQAQSEYKAEYALHFPKSGSTTTESTTNNGLFFSLDNLSKSELFPFYGSETSSNIGGDFNMVTGDCSGKTLEECIYIKTTVTTDINDASLETTFPTIYFDNKTNMNSLTTLYYAQSTELSKKTPKPSFPLTTYNVKGSIEDMVLPLLIRELMLSQSDFLELSTNDDIIFTTEPTVQEEITRIKKMLKAAVENIVSLTKKCIITPTVTPTNPQDIFEIGRTIGIQQYNKLYDTTNGLKVTDSESFEKCISISQYAVNNFSISPLTKEDKVKIENNNNTSIWSQQSKDYLNKDEDYVKIQKAYLRYKSFNVLLTKIQELTGIDTTATTPTLPIANLDNVDKYFAALAAVLSFNHEGTWFNDLKQLGNTIDAINHVKIADFIKNIYNEGGDTDYQRIVNLNNDSIKKGIFYFFVNFSEELLVDKTVLYEVELLTNNTNTEINFEAGFMNMIIVAALLLVKIMLLFSFALTIIIILGLTIVATFLGWILALTIPFIVFFAHVIIDNYREHMEKNGGGKLIQIIDNISSWLLKLLLASTITFVGLTMVLIIINAAMYDFAYPTLIKTYIETASLEGMVTIWGQFKTYGIIIAITVITIWVTLILLGRLKSWLWATAVTSTVNATKTIGKAIEDMTEKIVTRKK